MFRVTMMRSLWFAVLMMSITTVASQGLSSEGLCDIPGPNLLSQPQTDADHCRQSCLANEQCRAFVFVSGWNRCFLKSKSVSPRSLRIHAAQVDEQAGSRIMGPIATDHDESGKDLKQVSGVKDVQTCAERCLAERACKAIAYLDGYGDCWLKGQKGRLRPKTFSCAVIDQRAQLKK